MNSFVNELFAHEGDVNFMEEVNDPEERRCDRNALPQRRRIGLPLGARLSGETYFLSHVNTSPSVEAAGAPSIRAPTELERNTECYRSTERSERYVARNCFKLATIVLCKDNKKR